MVPTQHNWRQRQEADGRGPSCERSLLRPDDSAEGELAGPRRPRLVDGANGATDAWEPVDFDMFGQVVAAGKLLLTHLALVRLDPRVGPPVSG